MMDPQGNDVEDILGWDEIALAVATVMIVLLLIRLISSALLILLGVYDASLAEKFITGPLVLLIGISCAVFAVPRCIKKLRAASRTGVNGDRENRGTAEVLDGSDGAVELGIVEPRPPAVTIPISSSSRSGGGVSAGHGVVTAADVELARGSEPSPDGPVRSRERRVDMSGDKAVRDGKGKNA